MAIHLDRVDSRGKLAPRRDPYWHKLTQGRYVGFRKMERGAVGTWLARASVMMIEKTYGKFQSDHAREALAELAL